MTFDRSPFLYVGLVAVILVPVAHLEGVNRFAQLPQTLALHIVGLFGCALWAYDGKRRVSVVVLPAIVFCLAEVISIFQAQNRLLALLPISAHLASLSLVLVLLHGLTQRDYLNVIKVGCGVAGVVSLFGLLQFMGIGQNWVPTAGLPSATLGHRNLAGAYLIGFLPLTFWLWYRSPRLKMSVMWGGVMGLEGAFLLATRSRGAWVGLLVGICGVAIVRYLYDRELQLKSLFTHHLYGAMVAILLIVGVAFVPAQIEKGAGEAMWHGKVDLKDAVTSVVASGGDKSRLTLWQHTLSMIGAHPLVGVGAGNWRIMYPVYANGELMHPQTVPHRPHNDFLWIWSEMGIVGALGFVWLIWVVLTVLLRSLKTTQTGVEWALLCVLVAVVVNSCFGFSRAFPGAWLPFLLVVVGAGVLGASHPEQDKRVRWGAVVGLLVLLFSGLGIVRQIEFDRTFLRARLAFEQHRWLGVIQETDGAIQKGVFDEEALMMRGRALASVGQFESALDSYQAGLAKHPHSVGMWNGYGNTLRSLGKRTEARIAYLQALEFDPQSGETFNNLGTLYATSGMADSALAVYQKALEYAADLAPIYANMSILYRKKNQTDDAILYAQKALALKPDHLEALAAAGQAFLAGHRFADAAQAFSKAIKMTPRLAQMHFGLAQAYEGLGDARGAGVAYQDFLKLWTGPEVPQVKFAKKRLEFLTSP